MKDTPTETSWVQPLVCSYFLWHLKSQQVKTVLMGPGNFGFRGFVTAHSLLVVLLLLKNRVKITLPFYYNGICVGLFLKRRKMKPYMHPDF
jgi:hypothetical protein